MKNSITNIFKFLLFLGFGLAILYFVFQRQEAAYLAECALKGTPAADCSLIQKIIDDFKSVNYGWIAVVYLCYMISNVSRALRWKMLIKPLGRETRFVNLFAAIMLGYFGNLGLPRLGEVMRSVAVAKYEVVPVERVIGTVIVERLMDVLFLLLAIGLCLLIEFDTIITYLKKWQEGKDSSGGNSNLLVFVAVGGALILLVGWIFRQKIMASAFFKKIFNVIKGFGEGMLSIRKLDNPIGFWLHSFNIWFMYFLMTYFCFFAFEPTANLAPKVALMSFVVSALAIAVPSPGGMGTYHLFTINLLAVYGISEADGFSFANILFFSVQLGINVAAGLVALIALPIINKNYHPEPLPEEAKIL